MAKVLHAAEMTQFSNLVFDLEKDHQELSNLVASFRDAVVSSDRSAAREALNKIDDVATGHFRFERGYLYPRMRRLVFELIERLHSEQDAVKRFIKESSDILNKERLGKDTATSILNMLPALSKYLKDCNELIMLADKFGKEEKSDLNQKLKECSKRRVTK